MFSFIISGVTDKDPLGFPRAGSVSGSGTEFFHGVGFGSDIFFFDTIFLAYIFETVHVHRLCLGEPQKKLLF